MVTKYETEYENITFSFTVTEQHLATRFDWQGVRCVTPWHTVYFKVNVHVYDENSNWSSRNSFYIPLADWETKKNIREAVLQLIHQKIEFPEAIDGKASAQVFHKSVKKLNRDIREFYSEENYKGVVD